MLSQTLKESTRDVHAALEKQLITQIKAVDSKESYGRLLATLYGYYHPIEQQLKTALSVTDLPNLEQRRKSSWIIDDLRAISYPTDHIPSCEHLPSINSLSSALGVCYVLEGSTLGGKVISEMLSKKTGGLLDGALSFFQGYRDQTMPMWLSFRERLDLLPESNHAEAVDAATQTFTKFNHWITTYDIIEL